MTILEPWASVAQKYASDSLALLLGNGFSIHFWDKFNYASLLTQSKLSGEVKQLFKTLETNNFELVLNYIDIASDVCQSFDHDNSEIIAMRNAVRKSLADTVKDVHVSYGHVSERLSFLSQELTQFKSIFTTSYDLILYWIINFNNPENCKQFKDFFFSTDLSCFDQNNTELYHPNKDIGVYWLHGALHLFRDSENKVNKLRSSQFQINLLDRLHGQILDGCIPHFVSEGSSEQKHSFIRSSDYLTHCYRALGSLDQSLVILGHSLNKKFDGHLIEAINKSKIKRIFIGIYSDNVDEIDVFKGAIALELKKETIFFSSSSHPLFHASNSGSTDHPAVSL